MSLGLRLLAGSATYDFSTDPAAGGDLVVAGEGSNPHPWVAAGGNPGGFLALTYPTRDQFTSVVFPDLDHGVGVAGFVFEADVRLGNPALDRPADGFSISFVRPEDPILSAPGFQQNWVGQHAESGATTGLSIDFDTWDGNVLPDGSDLEGVFVRYQNHTIQSVEMPTRNGTCTDDTSMQTGPRDDAFWSNLGNPYAPESWAGLCWAHLKVEVDAAQLVTVTYKNRGLVDHLAAAYRTGPGRFVLAARTALASEHVHFDNIRITTTTGPYARGLSVSTLAGRSLSIAVKKLLSLAVDPAGRACQITGFTATTPGGGTVVMNGGLLTYSPAVGFTGSDSIELTFSNGIGSFNGSVDVWVGEVPYDSDPSPTLLSATFVGSDVTLRFAGIPGQSYQIQRTTDLMNPAVWQTVATVQADAHGVVLYTDPNPPDPSFWRTLLP